METPDFVKTLLDEVARKERFVEYETEFESGSNHGDNYMGVMILVKLTGDRLVDGVMKTETLNLICKTAPASKERREAFQADEAFKREIYMYTKVLPAFVRFQQEKGLSAEESFLAFPKVYATLVDEVQGNYALIMENLRAKNFVMWPRHDPIDLCHERRLLTEYGRFHGISLALKDQRPDEFAEFKQIDDVLIRMFEKGGLDLMVRMSMDRAVNALRCDEHKRLAEGLKRDYRSVLKESTSLGANERFGVLNHGDCWIANFMFQYDDVSKVLKKVCFLDWQLSRYASPVLDVLYHIFSTTRKELRDESLDELLRDYHTALSETVRKLGSDPDKLFGYADLKTELKEHGKYAMFMGCLVSSFVLAQQTDVLDVDEYTERLAKGENVDILTNGEESEVYIKVVNDLVGDILAYGYDH